MSVLLTKLAYFESVVTLSNYGRQEMKGFYALGTLNRIYYIEYNRLKPQNVIVQTSNEEN